MKIKTLLFIDNSIKMRKNKKYRNLNFLLKNIKKSQYLVNVVVMYSFYPLCKG